MILHKILEILCSLWNFFCIKRIILYAEKGLFMHKFDYSFLKNGVLNWKYKMDKELGYA